MDNAFVLALGNKARDRLAAAGLRFDAVGRHPSARVSDTEKRASWQVAADQFLGVSRTSPSTARPSAQPRTSRKQAVVEGSVAGDVCAAVNDLPEAVAAFFRSVNANSDYSYQTGRMQMMVYFRGKKVGGLNRQASHWYVSKVFVREYGSPALMEAHGFQHVVHNDKHDYWMATGSGALDDFQAAVTQMTGVPL